MIARMYCRVKTKSTSNLASRSCSSVWRPHCYARNALEVEIVCRQQLDAFALHHSDDQRAVSQQAVLFAILPARVKVAIGQWKDVNLRLA